MANNDSTDTLDYLHTTAAVSPSTSTRQHPPRPILTSISINDINSNGTISSPVATATGTTQHTVVIRSDKGKGTFKDEELKDNAMEGAKLSGRSRVRGLASLIDPPPSSPTRSISSTNRPSTDVADHIMLHEERGGRNDEPFGSEDYEGALDHASTRSESDSEDDVDERGGLEDEIELLETGRSGSSQHKIKKHNKRHSFQSIILSEMIWMFISASAVITLTVVSVVIAAGERNVIEEVPSS